MTEAATQTAALYTLVNSGTRVKRNATAKLVFIVGDYADDSNKVSLTNEADASDVRWITPLTKVFIA